MSIKKFSVLILVITIFSTWQSLLYADSCHRERLLFLLSTKQFMGLKASVDKCALIIKTHRQLFVKNLKAPIEVKQINKILLESATENISTALLIDNDAYPKLADLFLLDEINIKKFKISSSLAMHLQFLSLKILYPENIYNPILLDLSLEENSISFHDQDSNRQLIYKSQLTPYRFAKIDDEKNTAEQIFATYMQYEFFNWPKFLNKKKPEQSLIIYSSGLKPQFIKEKIGSILTSIYLQSSINKKQAKNEYYASIINLGIFKSLQIDKAFIVDYMPLYGGILYPKFWE